MSADDDLTADPDEQSVGAQTWARQRGYDPQRRLYLDSRGTRRWIVRGHDGMADVELRDDRWSCSCGSADCHHIDAARSHLADAGASRAKTEGNDYR